ncbi:MAG: ABC transporter ATP-binding protein [Christensenellales bacterium]
MLKLAVYLKNYKKECILGPAFKFLEVIFELLMPTIMALIINNGVARRDVGYVLGMGGLMIVLAVCGYGSAYICQRFASRASQGFGTVLRNAVFARILGFSYAQIDRFGPPTLTNRITNDINQLQQWVAMMIRLVSRAPFICIGALVMSFILDAKLALILLAATPVLAGIIYFVTKYAAPLYRSYQKRLDHLAVILGENLSGVRVVRAFAKNRQETARFRRANDELRDNGIAISRLSSLFNPMTSLVVNIVIVLILWFGGLRIDAGRLSQGQILAFINYVSQILVALLVVSNLIILLTKAMASAMRVNEILDTPPDMQAADDKVIRLPDASVPAIEFEGVSFGYNPTGERALQDINVTIKRGETVGIIGGTGSGKTTFVHLIARFYDATEGVIRIDGVPVREYPLEMLRKKIALVPQRVRLFTGTIAENIRWGNPQADMQAVRDAAQVAQADEFIQNLPRQYDAPVQRGGMNLSGGQRQRLSIARALVASAEILILDDASSALDFLTDARLRKAIRRSSRTQTVLLVSQRVGVVKNADRIIVLEDGEVAGVGTHDVLFETCETYREIYLSQISAEEAQL